MAAKPLDKKVAEKVLADWRTGQFSQGKLSEIYKISKSTVNKICKDVDQDNAAITNAGIEYLSGLAVQDERNANAIANAAQSEADRRVRFMSLRDRIAEKAFNRISNELDSCEAQHIKPLIEAADKTCVMTEIAPRFNANQTTINTQVNTTDEKPVFNLNPVRSHLVNDKH